MKHVKPFLYGLFDYHKQIREELNQNSELNEFTGNIYSNEYFNLERGQIHLYLNSRIYNTEEIRSALKMDSDDLAELVFELYLREGVKGFRRLNGKFTIIIQESEKTTIVRDRNGE
ncbi:MAG: hypothetical protein ABSD71_09765 [Bacteroidales bacterium]